MYLDDIKKVLPVVENKLLITVGDVVSQSCNDMGRPPDIRIIDFKTKRHFLTKLSHPRGVKAKNSPGTINTEAVAAYQIAVKDYISNKKPQTLIIDGEEDLLALPAILLAPLGSVVLYGQFDMGIVVNEVTEEKKQNVERLLLKFK